MNENSQLTGGHAISPKGRSATRSSRFEWRVVNIPRDMSRAEARTMLTEHAEYGQWELARSVLFVGGARRVWLRRRTMRVVRTDAA